VADILNMQDRRVNPRMLCADLVKIEWLDKCGVAHSAVANLEDISSSGACLQMEEDVPLQSVVKITHEKGSRLRVRFATACLRTSVIFWVLSLNQGSAGAPRTSSRCTCSTRDVCQV
jgi:hypothetical protein